MLSTKKAHITVRLSPQEQPNCPCQSLSLHRYNQCAAATIMRLVCDCTVADKLPTNEPEEYNGTMN